MQLKKKGSGKGLGRGLGALINIEQEDVLEKGHENNGMLELKINDIEPNLNQPRKRFDDEKLARLAQSIKDHGLVQPIIVRKEDEVYKIIAGERRYRAARIAEMTTIPVIVKDVTDKKVMEIALVENLQREDLNPIEEAEAFNRLINEHNLTQEEVSISVGKSRPAITNSLRLLGLNNEVKEYVINGFISSGHARALLAIENHELRIEAAKKIIDHDLSVRDTEELVKRYSFPNKKKRLNQINEEFIEIENRLKNILGTKVILHSNNNKKGKIVIEYYSNDELDRIINKFNTIS